MKPFPLLLLFVFFVLIECDVLDIYVSPTRGRVASSCGLASTSPCRGIEGMIARLNATCSVTRQRRSHVIFGDTCSSERRMHRVLFERGTYESDPLLFVNFRHWKFLGVDVIIEGDGSDFVEELTYFTSIGGRFPALFYLKNASDVTVENFHFRAKALFVRNFFLLITVDRSRDVVIRDVKFEGIRPGQRALLVYPAGGKTKIENCSLAGNAKQEDPDFKLIYIYMGMTDEKTEVILQNVRVTSVGNASYTFMKDQYLYKPSFGNNLIETDYDSTSTSTALLIHFDVSSQFNDVSVIDSSFSGIRSGSGRSPVSVFFEQNSANNSVSIRDTNFANNFALSGGALAVTLTPSNAVMLSNCSFSHNEALANGGAVFLNFAGKFTTTDSYNVTISDCLFKGNKALSGSALFLYYYYTEIVFQYSKSSGRLEDCHLQKVFVMSSTFFNNTASQGSIYTHRIHLETDGESRFLNNSGGAIFLVSSFLGMSGRIFFIGNSAEKGAGMAVISGSQVDVSRIESGHFENNFVNSYGGVLWADEASTAATYENLVFGDSFDYVDHTRPCFISFGNEYPGQKISGNITVINNTAGIDGDVVYAYTFRHCWLANFAPGFNLGGLQKQVAFVTTSAHSVHSIASSAPNYLAFEGASCRCFKPAGKTLYLSLEKCNSTEAQQLFSNISSLATSAGLLVDELQLLDDNRKSLHPAAGIGSLPHPDMLYFPWSWLVYSDDTIKTGSLRAATDQPNPSSIILTPSPGEEFVMNFTMKGQFLEPSGSSTYMELESLNGSVLLEVDKVGYRADEKVFFSPQQPLSTVRLHGREGSRGNLVVRAKSHLTDWLLIIRIPFILARCPLGFRSPSKSVDFNRLPNVINDDYLSTVSCSCLNTKSTDDDPIYSSTIRYCTDNATAFVNLYKWIGYPDNLESFPISNCSEVIAPNEPTPNGLSCYYINDPIDVVKSSDKTSRSAVASCVLNYCRYFSGDGLALREDGMCADGRQGLLCGQCKDGHAVTPSSLECQKCDDHYPIVVFLNAFFCLLIVVLVVGFNVKLTPILAALLFVTQTSQIFVNLNPASYFIIHIVNLDFSFGFCFSSSFSALARRAWHYFSPLYTIVLIGLLFLLNRCKVKYLSRLLSKRNCLNGLWLVVVLSYFRLVNVAFSCLRCVRIEPDGVISPSYRFLEDPSVACFDDAHLSLFIGSVLLLGLVLMPFPFAILWARHRPRFKPFGDIYCSPYKDERWWWCSVDLLRRFVFALLDIYVPEGNQFEWKCRTLTIYAVFLLLIQGLAKPYKSRLANVFEMLTLFDLCILSVLTSGRVLSTVDGAYVYVLVYLPWFAAACLYAYSKRDKIMKRTRKRSGTKSHYEFTTGARDSRDSAISLEKMTDKSPKPGLRDPLLEEE